MSASMKIEIWSDVVCPWCYIGKRRLETALADFPHRDEVEIEYRSFQLDPTAPVNPTETVAEHLGSKYGGGEAAGRRMIAQVSSVAAEEGMTWRHAESAFVNTLDAHRLLHLAADQGKAGQPGLQAALKEALLAAYFQRAENVADHDVLRQVATDVGLDAGRVDEVLAGTEYRDDVLADQRQAAAYGAGGVPFFVIDAKYGLSGAQPASTFTQVLEQAWAESHPVLEMATGSDGVVCGPDGCEVPASS